MIKRVMILGLVVAVMAMMAACGDDDDDNGGGGGGGMIGEASFDITGDWEKSIVDGSAYFDTLDLSDAPGPADYQFEITIAESIPIGVDTTHIRFSHRTDDGSFVPEPGEYDLQFAIVPDTWQGSLEIGDGQGDLVANEQGEATLTIDSASSSEVVGSFEVEFVEAVAEDDIEATATGSFRADPNPGS